MRIELINGQYRMLPGTPGSARDSTQGAKLVAPVAPSIPVQKQVEEDRIEIEGLTAGRALDVDRSEIAPIAPVAPVAHHGGVDARLIAGTVEERVDLPGAGQRNGLLDRTYFLQGPQLAAFNASRVGSAIDVRV